MAAEPEDGRTREGPKVRLWEMRMSWEERRQQRKFRTSGQISGEQPHDRQGIRHWQGGGNQACQLVHGQAAPRWKGLLLQTQLSLLEVLFLS